MSPLGSWFEAPPPGSVAGPPGWAVFDYQTRDLFTNAATGAAGEILTATLGPVPAGELWGVVRSTVSVAYTAAENLNQAGPVVRHYFDLAAGPVISGTNAGDYDEADYTAEHGLWVPEGRTLLAVWGAAPGASGFGVQATGKGQWHVQYVRMNRSAAT